MQLLEQQRLVRLVCHCRYVKINELSGFNRHHIVEAHNTEATFIQLQYRPI